MNKVRECEEIVTDAEAGKSYRFAGTFGFVRKLSLAGRDPSFIFSDLAEGLLPPDEIKNVVKFSLEQVDGEDVADVDLDAAAIEFIERAGLQDSSVLARIMMTHAMVGAIKKKQIRLHEATMGAIFKPNRSHWKTFAFLGLLWMGSLAISAALACMIFKLW